ncbi:MAG: insulinase family protein [Clostridia bacterium]|nr:insulinase family protein [Clostridia bacterium]
MKFDKKVWKYLVKCGRMKSIKLNVTPVTFRSGSLKYAFNFEEFGNGTEFCTVKAEGFKTACASVSFMLPLSDKASGYALVPNILTRSSEKYPTLTLLERQLATLYGAEIATDVSKIGEHQVLKVAIASVDDRFALHNEKIVSECCRVLFELVFNPKLTDGKFDAEEVESEKRLLAEQLSAEMSDKRVYAKNRCEEIMCEEELYGINRLGTVEDINAITAETLSENYKTLLKEARVLVSVSANGNIEIDSIKKMFTEYVSRIERNISLSDTLYVEKAEDVTYVKETAPVKQGKLVMGFRMGMKNRDDNYAARRIMTDVFGGNPNSKLFKVVREEMSLCYYCSARMVRAKGIMLVQSGIESFNEEKAKEAILNQLEEIKKGNFTEDDLDASKKALEDAFKSVSDSPEALDSWFTTQIGSGEYLYPEDYINAFKKVTKEEVIKAAEEVTLDTVFMLEGTEEDENQEVVE